MSLAVALILAASAPSQTAAPAQAPTVRGGVSATATASVTILPSVRIRLDEQDAGPGIREGREHRIHHHRRARGGRVLVELD